MTDILAVRNHPVIAKLEGQSNQNRPSSSVFTITTKDRTGREGLVKPVGITVVPAPTRPNDSLLWNICGQWQIDFAEFKEVEMQICEHSTEDMDILRKVSFRDMRRSLARIEERQSCALAGSVVC
ncbi:hypothetical protein FA15DRAFT_676367 [Coprinopsis marcescibilis]|uniref:Uncharacterized protein n=1 Tax=Coprinopsis marcescibilis TaxID=230819 RepID=A0A5C3KAB4_COPMA|nr:hypothetical protein FA15DRAFT_676367 [Coprinopsis marcescibilis]